MRIYLSGNEELASFHLPVVQAKAVEFANSCKRDGLSQNAMHFGFDDTGTQVSIQYVFGQTQVFIHAPHIIDVQTQGREEEQEPTPGTFYVETTQGYFWVHVLPDEEGELHVSLVPFEAVKQSEDIFSQ